MPRFISAYTTARATPEDGVELMPLLLGLRQMRDLYPVRAEPAESPTSALAILLLPPVRLPEPTTDNHAEAA